jgi:prepilin-type N-terminal cleavage/methylation domain-containing protein
LGQVGLFSAHRALAIPKDLGNVIPPHYGGFLLHLKTRTKIKQQGFTLLEIMLVVSIIVIILGVAISKLGNTTAIAKTMRVQADIQAIKTQLQLYESMNGFYPTTEQGLQALVTSRRTTRDLLAGTNCSENCPKIHGAVTIFIAILV